MTSTRYRQVHFHLTAPPDMAEVRALDPEREGTDVLRVEADPAGYWVVVVEVPESADALHAVTQATACLANLLPSVLDIPYTEDGVVVLVGDAA